MCRINLTDLKTQNMIDPLGIDTKEPVFGWIAKSDGYNKAQTAYRLQVATSEDKLIADAPDMWDSGKVQSDGVNFIPYYGKPLASCTKYFWRVKIWDEEDCGSDFSEISTFETAFLDQSEFYAKWITASPFVDPGYRGGYFYNNSYECPTRVTPKSMPVFARSFNLPKDKRISSARAYATGLGLFDLEINGRAVSDHWFEPGESDYRKEVYYVTYDVTDLLTGGDNAIAATVGKCYYIEDCDGKYKKVNTCYGELMLKVQLEVRFDDGTKVTVITDEEFYVNENGPITQSSWCGGEDYDATRELGDYSRAGYSYDGWEHARITEPMCTRLMAKNYNPIRLRESWKAVSVEQTADGVYLVDFGRNFAGVADFSLSAERGTVIELWPAELLGDDRRITQSSTGTPIWDSYTFKGEGEESWHPKFCYHGFRYVEVRVKSGKIGSVTPDSFTALLLGCDNETTGYFESSNRNFNVIHEIIVRSIEANMYNTVTDCPHREKLGWQEVPLLMYNSIAPNFDVHTWMNKIAGDTVASQTEIGLVPDICPEYIEFRGGFRDDPTWGGACIMNPYYTYKWYNDKQRLAASYETMVRYMDYLASMADGHILNHGLGDWAALDENATPVSITVTCTYFDLARAMSEIAGILGKDKDQEKYAALAKDIRAAVNDKFFDKSTCNYSTGSQGANAMAIYYGIVEDEHKSRVLQNLVKSVKEADYHIGTGEIALKPLFISLADNGEMETLIKMLLNKTMPSYLYFVEQNATSLPEYWDMQASQLHCILGHAEGWLYEYIAGIKNTSVGYKTFSVKPYFCDYVDTIHANVKSLYGDIKVDYEKRGGKYQMCIEVPFGATALVELEKDGAEDAEIDNPPLINNIREGKMTYILGSGKYNITV